MTKKEKYEREVLQTKFDMEKEIEKLRHKNKLAEIEAEKLAKIEASTHDFDCKMSLHRLKRADIRRSQVGRDMRFFGRKFDKTGEKDGVPTSQD